MSIMSLVERLMKKEQGETTIGNCTNINNSDLDVPEISITDQDCQNRDNTMQGTAYLVDSENVGLSWVDLLRDMTEQDTIYIFFTQSNSSSKVSYGELSKILGCSLFGQRKLNVEFMECVTGKNAMDMQICTMYGYLIAKNKYNEIKIVSRDSSFGHATYIGDKLIGIEQNNVR